MSSTLRDGGSRLTALLSDDQQKDLPKAPQGAKAGVSLEYTSVTHCDGNTPENPGQVNCPQAVNYCASNPPEAGLGPAVEIWHRPVNPDGTPTGGWTLAGISCLPDLAPGRPTLSLAQVIAAFRDTPFARPTVKIQPEGGVTLVNLPTYYRIEWPAAGFQPGEIDHPDPAAMAGFTVEIRPVFVNATWHPGTGEALGPTDSQGGTYPDGDITYTYKHPGAYPAYAQVTYTGQYRVGGGEWLDIPDTVTITGPTTTITVREATAQLVK